MWSREFLCGRLHSARFYRAFTAPLDHCSSWHGLMYISFFSFNWKPLPTESSRGRCLCSMQQLKFLVSELGEDLSNLKCVTTVFTECISATLRQHVFVVVNPSFHFHTVHTKHFDATLLLMYLYLTSCCFILIKCRHD